MTGRQLILYILLNDLEDEIVFKDGVFIGFMTEEDAALKFGVGVATIRAWYQSKTLDGMEIGEHIYFLRNIKDPRKTKMKV